MNKKSQEEMVGFVMVVVVVAVIFLVFLGIMMRKPGAAEDRTQINEVSLFLDAFFSWICTRIPMFFFPSYQNRKF